MRVYPKPLEIGEEEGFSTEKDLFGKAQLASGMSHLVATIEDPLVIAFDGKWGSGKTTFLKMWAGELRRSGHPVIFFDAFENDYVDDAFAALAREIVELAEDRSPLGTQIAESIREKAAHLGTLLLKSTTKVGIKVAVRAATAGLVSSNDFKEIGNDVGKEMEDTASKYMDQILDHPRKQKQIVTNFREALARLPTLLASPNEGEPQKSLIFIIDELDRCKPLFALSLLERIKHFMLVPNVHFVLGVHITQLQSSVRYAYGNDIDAPTYLQKFINLTIFNVDMNETHEQDSLQKYADYLVKNLEIRRGRENVLQESIETILRIIRHEEISYRTLERAFTVLSLAIGLAPENQFQIGALTGGLVMMKLLRPHLYRKAKQGSLTLEEASAFLRFSRSGNENGEISWEERCWVYALSDTISEEIREIGRSLFQFNRFSTRKDIVKYVANKVVDRISPN